MIKIVYLIVLFAILFTSATYTWFSISRVAKVTDNYVTIHSYTGMEIAWTNTALAQWGQSLDFSDYVKGNVQLKPITYNEQLNKFFAMTYRTDGRRNAADQPLSDELNANKDDTKGHYLHIVFYAKTDTNIIVSLAPAGDLAGSYLVGTPYWNPTALIHENLGNEAEYAARVAFMISKFDEDGKIDSTERIFWEPNSDRHTSPKVGYLETPSIFTNGNLFSSHKTIIQETTSWIEKSPALRDNVAYTFGRFVSDNSLFELAKGQQAKIDIYLWLEGQDVDCNNELLADECNITLRVHFQVKEKIDSGLEEIPQP